jgi:hypothetical protein
MPPPPPAHAPRPWPAVARADRLGEFADRDLHRIADVDRAGDVVRRVHQPHRAVDEVVHVAERARLQPLAIERDGLAAERLHDEVGDHAAVVGVHARPVGVEDAQHLDAQPVLAVVVEEQRLGAALAFVVAGADADRVDVAPVVLALRVHLRVAVDLAGRGLQDLGLHALGQAEHVDGTVHAGLGGLHRVVLVVHRRGRAGEVVDLVDLDVERKGHVVAQQLEARMADQVLDVAPRTGEEVVDAQHVVAAFEQLLAQVRAQEAGTAGDEARKSGRGVALFRREAGRRCDRRAASGATSRCRRPPGRA